jgi:hypothetical protein
MTPLLTDDALRAAKLLGIDHVTFGYIGTAPTPEQSIVRLREFLPELRSRWRRLIFESHPDRGGSRDRFEAVPWAWEVVQQDEFARLLWHRVREPKKDPEFPSPLKSGTATGFKGFSDGAPFFVRRF